MQRVENGSDLRRRSKWCVNWQVCAFGVSGCGVSLLSQRGVAFVLAVSEANSVLVGTVID